MGRPAQDIASTGNYPESNSVTITSGTSLSAALHLDGTHPVALVMPAAWDAASITFQTSDDGTTWSNLYDSSSEYTISSAGASRRIILNPSDFASVTYLKIRSGTSGAAVNQTADRIIKVIARGV